MEKNKHIYHYLLEDEKVGLRRIEEDDDFSNYHKWFNDQEINKYTSHAIFPMTMNMIKLYLADLPQNVFHLSIYEKTGSVHIGNISLLQIDNLNQHAELAIVLGEKDFTGKNYSYRACSLLLDHAFKRMNLNRIYCSTSEFNIGMQKLALKLGMKEEGRRKQALWFKDKFVDMVEFGIVK
jgi:ribosomal-protein-alanine N-acetyltransferase